MASSKVGAVPASATKGQWEGPWPSLGPYVCDFIEANLCHGPGPVKGQAVTLTEEEVRFIFQFYEVHPKALCGRRHCSCPNYVGKFRYEWGIYCRLKGARKSELAAWLTHVELKGPCRFGGWDAEGDAVAISLWDMGGSVDIPFAATSEDQSKDTAWASFYEIAKMAPYADDLDIYLDRVNIRRNGAGNARVVTSSSIRSDGGRPTFTVEEECHLWELPEYLELDRVLDFNLAKLGANDPHGLKVSTMFGEGRGSVLERDYETWKEGNSNLLFDLRSARDGLDPTNEDDILTGVTDAIGEADWLDPFRILGKFKKNRRAGVRYWWNKLSADDNIAVTPNEWRATTDERVIEDGEIICLGFDGSLYDDCTALMVCHFTDGYQWPAAIIYPDGTEPGVEAMRSQIELALFDLSARFRIAKAYCDPPHWGEHIAKWQAAYGDKTFLSWWTNRDTPMSWATHRWYEGIATKTWRHSADEEFAKQVTQARRRATAVYVNVEEGIKGWVPQKDRPGSPKKVDACVASILAMEARTDAIRLGLGEKLKPARPRRLYSF